MRGAHKFEVYPCSQSLIPPGPSHYPRISTKSTTWDAIIDYFRETPHMWSLIQLITHGLRANVNGAHATSTEGLFLSSYTLYLLMKAVQSLYTGTRTIYCTIST